MWCTGLEQGRRPRAYGSGRLVNSGDAIRREGRHPARSVGASVPACWKGSRPARQHRNAGVEAATPPKNLLLPLQRRALPLGEGQGVVTGASVWQLPSVIRLFGAVEAMMSRHSIFSCQPGRMAAPSGAIRMPGNPFIDQDLFGEGGRGKEARRTSFLTKQRRDSWWVSSRRRRVDWIPKAGWSFFEPAPSDTFGYLTERARRATAS